MVFVPKICQICEIKTQIFYAYSNKFSSLKKKKFVSDCTYILHRALFLVPNVILCLMSTNLAKVFVFYIKRAQCNLFVSNNRKESTLLYLCPYACGFCSNL